MKLTIGYHLVGGEAVSYETSDFGSIDEARDICAKMISTPHASASVRGADGVRIINVAQVVHITITRVPQ